MSISNSPPPLDAHSLHIEELIAQATDYLDGKPIETQGQANDVGKLLDMIRQAQKAADAQRVIEKKPHDDAAKAVQSAWKPLLDRCDTAASIAKRALTPWLTKLAEEQEAEAKKARDAAMALQQAALDAQRAAQASNELKAEEAARAATKIAEAADRAANKAEKATPNAAGGARSIGLRTSYKTDITDWSAFARWCWINRRDEMENALMEIAARIKSPIPIEGANIRTVQEAV